jgi:soluble lytic murein transglycosylase
MHLRSHSGLHQALFVLPMSILRTVLAVFLLFGGSAGVHADLLSPEDLTIYRAAFAAAHSGDWTAAHRAASQANVRLPAKILRWLELMRSDMAGFSDIVDFAERNPSWPSLGMLRHRAERTIAEVPDSVLAPYFQDYPPVTVDGKLRFADILAASGRRDASLALIRQLWIATDLGPEDEALVLARHDGDIRAEDHIARLDRLIWDGQNAAAKRQLPRVPENWRLLAEARLGLASLQAGGDAVVARVPSELQRDPGLVFELARWNRRKDLLENAAQIFQSPPRNLVRPPAWWAERDILVRRLLDSGQHRLAYALVARRGLGENAVALADAEFLAGWIALRRLDDPAAAYEHFTQLYANVRMPISRARGAYWAGRAADERGLADIAKRWFASAAEHSATFYGQLAAQRSPAARPAFAAEPWPTAEDVAEFDRKELVRAARMLSEIGEGDLVKPFLLRLGAAAGTPVQHKLVGTLAEMAGWLDVAAASARRASADGTILLASAFPVIQVKHKGIAEPPLVLAIARQESAFDKAAVSRAGARGLMQLKPATAKDIAKSLSIRFSADRLLTDPNYNLTLGRAYIDKLLDRFGGSYVLALAAYNAGPARVQQWLEAYGDPRAGTIDVIDWIEAIPFAETRNYVQRVLEALQVYRLRLGDDDRAFTLARDLQH